MIWTDALAGLSVRPGNGTVIVALNPKELELDHGQAGLMADAFDRQGKVEQLHTVQGEQFVVEWYIDNLAGKIRYEVRGGFQKKIFPKEGKRLAEAIRNCLASVAVPPEDQRRDDGLRRVFN